MASLEEVTKTLQEYINNPLFVFKICKNSIVVLKKLEDTITNESRSDVVDKNYAKFRGNKFYVEKIINLTTLEEMKEDTNWIHFKKNITYVSGTTVEELGFESKLDQVCAQGIHYFLTLEPAYYYYMVFPLHGTCKEWHDNGQKAKEYNRKNRMFDGKYEEWYRNGQKAKECNYVNDILDGKYEAWHENGQQKKLCNYVDGMLDGNYKQWYNNGQIESECVYKDRKLDGIHREWYDNTQIKLECTYKDNFLDGLCTGWYENGQKAKECNYKNNNVVGTYKQWHENGKMIVERNY